MQQAFPCPKCGTQIPVGQLFCNSCGQYFEYRCRHCGNAIKTSTGLCTHCGKKLNVQIQPPAEPPAKKVTATRQYKKTRQPMITPQPTNQVGRYLLLITIIIFIGAILYAIGTGPQGETSHWFGGSFIFGGQSPPSTPPNTYIQQ
ncbi:MAG: zinc ribbon domain-containing protein, partial [Chloroflexota bacterium]